MKKDNCDRCGKPTNGVTIMSMFNHDIICMPCKDVEKREANYNQAVEADHKAIRSGDYNFPGIGRGMKKSPH